MKRLITAVIMLTAILLSTLGADRQKVGLVLSGGGAKGIAHIGVIQALEENGIPIDYITGTSMGAIVGSLYAAGYSPDEMLELLGSKGFAYWSTGKIDPDYTYFFMKNAETPSFVTINLGKDSTQITSVLPMSLVNPLPMNYAFIELYSPYSIQCGQDFDKLFVPFRCVTSDVYTKHKVVMRDGPLGDAVRMSMSFPMIFEPIELDGVPMYDGGIYDNYPVDVMMDDFAPDALIGVNVGSKDAPPSSRNMLDQLEEMIMQPNDYPFPYDKGVNIRIDLDEFGLLDFPKYREIYAIGYRRGLEMIDSVKMKVHARTAPAEVAARRDGFKALTPTVAIDSIHVSGGTPTENAYLTSLFKRNNRNAPLSLVEARDAYYRAVSTNKLQNFVPTPVYHSTDSTFGLDFKAVVKDNFNVGVGGYISSSTNSMLFLNAGYNNLNFKSINVKLNGWLGQSYLAAEGDFRLLLPTRRPSALVMRVVTSRQTYHETEKLFYEVHAPDFIKRSETFIRGFYSAAPSLRTKIDFGAGFGHLTDRYHANIRSSHDVDGYDKGIFNLGEILARWEYNTLDNPYSPTSGAQFYANGLAVTGRYNYYPGREGGSEEHITTSWLQADISATNYWSIGKHFALGGNARALLSTRKLLPTYDASIVAATAFHPTPSSYNYFNASLRANSFLTLGVTPIWKISGTFQLRGTFHGFLPIRKIKYDASTDKPYYGRWLSDPEFFGELQALLTLPFGTVSAYGNYTTNPSGNWNFGISIGAFILAPKFIH